MDQETATPIPVIDLTPVQSSQIAALGHDPVTNTLRVQFQGSGSTYDYAGVSAETAADFLKAESIGKFFGAQIKGKFEYRKLPAKKADS
jgi:hypothetical protein